MKKILFGFMCFLSINIININAAENLKLDCTKELNTKSTGTNVKTLQKMLNSVASCNLRVDGGYGTNTANCVKKYQEAKKVTSNGVVNSKTCSLLNNDYKNKKTITTNSNTTSTTNKVTTTTTNPTQDLKLDCTKELNTKSTGTNVKTLQKMLNSVASCNLRVDGGYGTNTANCVKKYQEAKKVTSNGVVNSKTCSLLNNDYKNKKTITTNSNTTSTTNKTTASTTKSNKTINGVESKIPLSSQTNSVTILGGITLRKGSSGNNVRLLKQELNKVMDCKLEITSIFDDNTYNCVVRFQKKYNLETDGSVGSKTISELNKVYKYQQVLVKTSASIRKSNSASSSIIKSVSRGTRLNIMESPKDNSSWIKVEYNGQIGYIKKTSVSLDFIEVDITSQVLRYYKNGNLYVDSIITTGKYGSNGTPKGYRTVNAKKRNNRLMPADVVVDYWIATDNYGSIGIHDASWRGTNPNYTNYGGVVYKGKGEAGTKYSGSHGCINTPKSKVKIIYENISVGTPIYIY